MTITMPLEMMAVSQDQEEQEQIVHHNQRVLRSLADICNKFPFAGKIVIAIYVSNAIREKNPYYKTVKTIEAVGFLGILIYGHSSQALLGIQHFQQNLENFGRTQSPETLLACGIDVAYTAANCAATYAQLHLSGRLTEHFFRTNGKAVPRLAAWGINGDEVNYDQVEEKLMTAIINNAQEDIDTFFMILPKEKKQQVMESIKVIADIVNATCSYEEMTKRIAKLEEDVETKSRFRYILEIIKNAHLRFKGKIPYSFKETMKMLVVTWAGQMGFIEFG